MFAEVERAQKAPAGCRQKNHIQPPKAVKVGSRDLRVWVWKPSLQLQSVQVQV